MQYSKIITLNKKQANFIIDHLSGAAPFNEGDTITLTSKFANGIQMDIKCCGAPLEYGGPYTEAVLFNKYGGQIALSDPGDELEASWELQDGKDSYVTTVIIER